MRSAITVALLLVGPLCAEEILRIEGAAFGDFFDLAHAPGSEMVVTDEGLQGTGGGALYSSIIDVDVPADFVRAEWELVGASAQVTVMTAVQHTGAAPTIDGGCFRYFLRNGQEVDLSRYESSPSVLRGDVVAYPCIVVPLEQVTLAASGEGVVLDAGHAHMQLRFSISASEPFALRSLLLYDDAGSTAVEATSWAAVKEGE